MAITNEPQSQQVSHSYKKGAFFDHSFIHPNLANDIDGLQRYFSFQHRNWFTSGSQREEGQVLSLFNISRKDDGVYVCVADNGVNGVQAASARIALNVLCK